MNHSIHLYLRGGVARPIGGGGAGTGALLIGELDYAEQGELLWTQEYGYEMDYCVKYVKCFTWFSINGCNKIDKDIDDE